MKVSLSNLSADNRRNKTFFFVAALFLTLILATRVTANTGDTDYWYKWDNKLFIDPFVDESPVVFDITAQRICNCFPPTPNQLLFYYH